MALPFLFIIIIMIFNRSSTQEIIENASLSNSETYIVHVKSPESRASMQTDDLYSWYNSFLPINHADSDHHPRLVYSYQHVVSGFAAKLTAEQVKAMENKEGLASIHPETKLTL